MCVDENQNDLDTPIIFPEWSLMLGTKLKRRDFRLDVMLKANNKPKSEGSWLLPDKSSYWTVPPFL